MPPKPPWAKLNGLLAYMDVFLYCAILAFVFVPFTFLFSAVKATRKVGPE